MNMIFGKSPDAGRWHILDAGRTACHRSRTGGQTSSQWETISRLPPPGDPHCFLCFPWHVPPVVPLTTRPGWDLDRFLGGL